MIEALLKLLFALFLIICGVVTVSATALSFNVTMDIRPVALATAIGAVVLIVFLRVRRRRSSPPVDRIVSDSVFEGVGATVELAPSSLLIRRHGLDSAVVHGLKGDKRIPFSSITAVQHRPAGRTVNGYLQFSILGGNESRAGIWDAAKDENSVMFTREQADAFERLRTHVEAQIGAAPPARGHSGGMGSVADQLGALAMLHKEGALSDDEFSRAKAAALNSGSIAA